MSRFRSVISTTLCVAMSVAAACTTVAEDRPGVRRVQDSFGDEAYEHLYDASPEAVMDAARRTYERYEFLIHSQTGERIDGRTATGGEIVFRVSRTGALTRARVSITPGNDEGLSLAIFEQVGDFLED